MKEQNETRILRLENAVAIIQTILETKSKQCGHVGLSEKINWNYKKGTSYPICLLCLNFVQGDRIHNLIQFKNQTRYTIVGKCICYGWEVSAFDRCDSWQDDA